MITFTNFSGMTPAVTPKRLQDGQSEVAINCDFSLGDLRPMRANVPDGTHTGTPPRSIYLHRHENVRYWYRLGYGASFVAGMIPESEFGSDQNPVFWTVDEVASVAWPRTTSAALQGNPGQSVPLRTFRLGVPTPLGAPSVSGAQVPDEDNSQGVAYRAWAYTLVNSWGQEGPLSIPSDPILTPGVPDATVGGFDWDRGTGDGQTRVISKKRIYRSATGSSTQTRWLYVGETAGASFKDDKRDQDLGGECPTRLFSHPPEMIRGLTALPNGVLAAFRGHDLYFSHPYHPYAWPDEYVLTASNRISGLASMGGTSMLVGTRGHPYICTGTDPLSMSLSRLDISQSCIDALEYSSASSPYVRRTMVSLGVDGAAYASPDGLVVVPASGGARLATRGNFTQAQWQWMTSGDVVGFSHDGEYVCCCSPASSAGTAPLGLDKAMDHLPSASGRKQFSFIYNLATGTVRFSDFYASVGHLDLLDDALYFVEPLGSGWRVVRWSSPLGAPLRYFWRSKPMLVPRTNHGVVKVVASEYAAQSASYGNAALAMKILVDGEERFSSPIFGLGPWRLASGFTGRVWTIILEGTAPVQSVIIGGEE